MFRFSIGPAWVFNTSCAILAAGLGAVVLHFTTPLLFDWQRAEMVLVQLPSMHIGFAPWVKVVGFTGFVIGAAMALVWGVWSAIRPRSPRTTTVNVIALATFGLFLAGAEMIARVAVAFDLAPLNSPDYYTNPHCGDDNFKMRGVWAGSGPSDNVYHSVLGWTEPRSPDHPEGRAWPPRLDGRPKMVFYGDSFMLGTVEPADSIPARVESIVGDHQALNLGVGGYGLDQIWLRYKLHGDRLPAGSTVVFGVLTVDLDRSLNRFRGALKPIYRPAGDSFELFGVPPPRDVATWLEANPHKVRSFGLALLGTIAELLVSGFDRSEFNCHRDAKKAVSRFILDQARSHAATLGHRLIWVLFVPTESFHKPADWRHTFLRDYFASADLPWVDGLDVIRRAAADNGSSTFEFFFAADSHLNARGNAAIASAIAETLPK